MFGPICPCVPSPVHLLPSRSPTPTHPSQPQGCRNCSESGRTSLEFCRSWRHNDRKRIQTRPENSRCSVEVKQVPTSPTRSWSTPIRSSRLDPNLIGTQSDLVELKPQSAEPCPHMDKFGSSLAGTPTRGWSADLAEPNHESLGTRSDLVETNPKLAKSSPSAVGAHEEPNSGQLRSKPRVWSRPGLCPRSDSAKSDRIRGKFDPLPTPPPSPTHPAPRTPQS